jgi:hypothetical protein
MHFKAVKFEGVQLWLSNLRLLNLKLKIGSVNMIT